MIKQINQTAVTNKLATNF